MRKRREEMLTAPVEKLICRMAIPTILGMLVTAVYSMTDTFFIGLLGNATLTAAVGVVFYFMSVVQAVGFLFGYGSGNYIARCIGREDEESAGRMAATGCVLAVGLGILIMLAGWMCLPWLVSVLGGNASPELEVETGKMLKMFLLGVPGMTGALCLYNQLRLEGSMGGAITGMGVGMLLNMVLDPVFILVLRMGVSGAALATVIGQYAGFIVLWLYSLRGECIPVKIGSISFEKALIKEMFCGGAPNFIRQSITTVSGILLNHIAGGCGADMIAAFTVVQRIVSMLTAGVIGFGQGFQSVCAVNFGAGRMDRVKRGFRFCVKIATITLSMMGLVVGIFAPGLVGIFGREASVCRLGIRILRLECMALPFMGYTTLAGMLLQNIGQFGKAAVVTSLRQGILFLPLIAILPSLFGMTGVMLVQPLADLLAFPVALVIGEKQIKKWNSI